MTAAEIVMKRDDPNIAWGFRLTGGSDLGTPFYVVKVLGRGHAERAGLRVGDMVYAINNKYINTFTHKDAQNAIVHTGDTLVLNIKRGPIGGRGTPLPEYADPLMGIIPPPPTERPKPVPLPPYEPPPPIVKEPTPPPESDEEEDEAEETVAAFNVKINPKGRIAAIEELPVTPPPSRSSSRCRSRSRSASRDRRSSSKRTSQPRVNGLSGPGEAFTYSKEVVTQYSTVLSASEQSGGQTAQTINESFIIHGGSEHKMEGE
uniref:PDZ domain-containing protein n=1 Tax=Graphocephala atropunctata TaxID=36148 RepID=A0A1B6LHH6_9HEMI